VRISKIIACIIISSLLLTGPLVVQAASKNKKDKKKPQPIEISADELYFSDKTGELFARGNVVITQGDSKILANVIRGNEKRTEVWVDEKVQFLEPKTDLAGIKLFYNYGSKFGSLNELSGKCGSDWVWGKQARFEDGKYTIYDATMTGCPMKGTPDYRTTARKVVIWPDDKLIAYDAKLWIKNSVIYSTPRYKRSLKKGSEENEFPSFGYVDKDGFFISQSFDYPVSDSLSLYLDAAYYSAAGFKPAFGFRQQMSTYGLQGIYGEFRDGNGNWIKKEPELSWSLYSRKLGSLPVNYSINATYGKWTDSVKSSWHQDYNLYFSHFPIYFDKEKSWILNLGAGIQYVKESYDDSSQNIYRYNIGLSKKLSPSLNTWVAYNFTNNNNSAFAYNKIDVAQEGVAGLSWKINNRTSLSYYTSYDLAKGQAFENYYTLTHSFHCWEMALTYRAVKQEFLWTVNIVRW
jgi:LPS-assembly protein